MDTKENALALYCWSSSNADAGMGRLAGSTSDQHDRILFILPFDE